jgi:hypothetical protein
MEETIQKNDTTKIIIKVTEFQGEKGVDLREYIETKNYTGPTKKGFRVPVAKWDEFKVAVNKVEPA